MGKPPRGYTDAKLNEAWQRYRLAYEMHEAGESYAAIGAHFGVSRGRAFQIAQRWARRLRYLKKAKSP